MHKQELLLYSTNLLNYSTIIYDSIQCIHMLAGNANKFPALQLCARALFNDHDNSPTEMPDTLQSDNCLGPIARVPVLELHRIRGYQYAHS